MKVLVLNGSPKGENSNTMKLTHAFLEGAGWQDIEIIDVSKVKIQGCLGCFACWSKTPGKCVINDEMSSTILNKLIFANIIIWSFPLYYFSIPGKLKNLMDRQLPLSLPFMAEGNESGGHPPRYNLQEQRHIIISTCGFWTSKNNYDAVETMFNHCYGTGNYSSIFCGQGELFRVPELKSRTDEYLEIVHRAGEEFTAGGIHKDTQDELAEPLYPRDVFEKMADASWGISKSDKNESAASDDSLSFTTQMAALYQPDGTERVLEFWYTDINKTYQILLTKSGSEVITDNFKPYTTRIETPYSVWRSISRGEITGEEALFDRKYKVLGNFDLMLKWDELFGSVKARKPVSTNTKQRKTNMSVLLFPWIIIWVTMAINPTIGGAAGILSAACLPLLWLIFKPVVFEQVSVPIIAGLSLAILLGTDKQMILPASYAFFGLMWLIGALLKTPLTAYYSANNYGGGSAFNNKLFMRTNRILTATWSVLYLITPIWTYFLLGTELSAYTGLINSACPALMGVFTVWFQRWYPARWAKG